MPASGLGWILLLVICCAGVPLLLTAGGASLLAGLIRTRGWPYSGAWLSRFWARSCSGGDGRGRGRPGNGNGAPQFGEKGFERVPIPSGGREKIHLVPTAVGTFEYRCNLPWHQMIGTIVVKEQPTGR